MYTLDEKYYLPDLVDQVIKIVEEAGEAIMQVYSREFVVVSKKDQSPLTEADLASNEVIVSKLSALTPDIPIISEESAAIPYGERQNQVYLWCVDPLDGTKEFVKRNGEFSINVALLENGRAILGIVGIPALKYIAWGLKSYGAFLEKGDMSCRLEARTVTLNQNIYDVVSSRSHLDIDTKAFAESYGPVNWIPKGSSMKFVMVAGGEADFYPRLGPTMEWDTAAPQIIVEEAGGSVLDLKTGQALSYNKPSLYNPDFVVFGRGDNLL